MGKSSLKQNESNIPKQRRQTRASSNNKYLRPGALAQLRQTKLSTTKTCTDLGKKRVALSGLKKADHCELVIEPERFKFSIGSPLNFVKQNSLPKTPKTPRFEDRDSESRLESLPVDILVKIVCHMQHDQLRNVFHVSQRVRMAVIIARQFHFNYTTPDRSHQEILLSMTPLPTENWRFHCKGESRGIQMPSPHTPKAPRHGLRPPSRFKCADMRPVAAVLFQETPVPSRCLVPSVLQKPSVALQG